MATIVSTPVDLIEEAVQLGEIIIESQVFQEYTLAKQTLEEDEEAQQLIANFLKWKEQHEEVTRFGKYHPDYKTVTNSIREAKRAMDMHESVATFRKKERELESLLHEIAKEIAHAVSPSIKVPSGNPFFDSSCGTGCGSGGSCGCR